MSEPREQKSESQAWSVGWLDGWMGEEREKAKALTKMKASRERL